MIKKELRQVYREKRGALSSHEIEELSMVIAQRVLNEIQGNNQHIHVFSSIPKFNEPDTSYLVKLLLAEGHTVYTSIIEKDSMRMNHVRIDAHTLYEPDAWGIPVPVNSPIVENPSFDFILVPLLCCDKKGNRVGYGKGFYDLFLKNQPNAFKAGIGFFDPVDSIEDVQEHDIKIDIFITPEYTWRFSDGRQ